MNAADTHEEQGAYPQSQDQDPYQELVRQHHRLDDRLHELTQKPYLSDAEQFEEVTLKKKKLALKDRMQEIAREGSHLHAH